MLGSPSARDRLRELLADRRSLWLVLAAALVLGLFTLDVGLVGDDLGHYEFLRAQHEGRSGAPWWDMFGLVEGPPAKIVGLRRAGRVPWWTDPQLRVVFFRPLAAATHHLDHALWPDAVWLMHLHSVAWHLLACGLAWALARRLCSSPSTAALAALIYALASAHTIPVAWLAHRNGLVSTSFALAALLAHDHWRRGEGRTWWAGLLAPLALAAALLSAEAGVVGLAFVIAHALIFDPARGPHRVLAVLPGLFVVAIWWALYSAQGFGAVASGAYCDPLGEPATFFGLFFRRYPTLLATSLALPLVPGAPSWWGWGPWLVSAVLVALAAALFLIRAPSKPARFGALALVLGCLPLTASHPGDRLLVLTSFGAALIYAELLAAWLGARPATALERLAAGLVLLVHLLLPPVARVINSVGLDRRALDGSALAIGESLPNEGLGRRGLVIVHAPSLLAAEYLPAARALRGLEVPNFVWLLHTGPRPPSFVRVDARSVELHDPRGWPGDEFSGFWRSVAREPFAPGDRVETLDYVAEVLEVEGGRATRVRFRFRARLEHPSFVWSAWDGRDFVTVDPRGFARE